MNTYSQIQFVKRDGYNDVIIYYSRKGEKFRPLTGVKVLSKHLTEKGSISTSHPNYEEDIRSIKAMHDKVESLIDSYKKKYGEKPPVKWLEEQFNKPIIDAKKDLNDILCYWKEFIAEKKTTTKNEGTIKRYNNLEGTIRKYENARKKQVTFARLYQDFFNDFLHYLAFEHEYVRNPKAKVTNENKPEIGLSNETSIKRLKDFVEYLKYCNVEFDININIEKIKKYIKTAKYKHEVRPLSKTQKWELTLTTDEIQFAANLEYYEPDYHHSLSENQNRYLEIFLFMCLQGTAPIDAKDIHKTDIRNGKIVKDRSKSGNEFKVELDPIAEAILIKNDYSLDFTDQTVNQELKNMFVTIFELYRKHFEKKYNEKYEIICFQKVKKGFKDVIKIQHKGLFVELMTGRRSFITNLSEKADELGLKETMDKAGHTQIKTTLGYVHARQQPKKGNKGGLFGIFKIKDQLPKAV